MTQCLSWKKGISIPLVKWDTKQGKAIGRLDKLPYMCGADKAYRIKNAGLASQISPSDYIALPAASQNGAYDLLDTVPLDQFNPNDGRYSLSFKDDVQYAFGAVVNTTGKVYKCISKKCTDDPILSASSTQWEFIPNEAPPPSRRVQIEEWSSVLTFYKNDVATLKSDSYKCIADDVEKVQNGQTFTTNTCNNGKPDELTSSWKKIGSTSTVNLTQAVYATPFNAFVNYKVGDYYADATL